MQKKDTKTKETLRNFEKTNRVDDEKILHNHKNERTDFKSIESKLSKYSIPRTTTSPLDTKATILSNIEASISIVIQESIKPTFPSSSEEVNETTLGITYSKKVRRLLTK